MENYFTEKSIAIIVLIITSKLVKIRSILIIFSLLSLFGVHASNQSLGLLDSETHPIKLHTDFDTFILGRGITVHFGHIKLKASTANLEYFTDFYFNSNATSGLDPGYDAALYNSGNPPAFSIYSQLVEDTTGLPFMIQALSETAMNNVTIALGLHANQGQEVTISILETDMPDTINIYLEDRSNNTFTLLNTNDYTFTAESNLSGYGHFYLRFEAEALNITNPSIDALEISTNQLEHTIEISGQLETKTALKLYDIHGRAILSNNLDISAIKRVIDVSHLSTGIYIAVLETISGEKRKQKLILQ